MIQAWCHTKKSNSRAAPIVLQEQWAIISETPDAAIRFRCFDVDLNLTNLSIISEVLYHWAIEIK